MVGLLALVAIGALVGVVVVVRGLVGDDDPGTERSDPVTAPSSATPEPTPSSSAPAVRCWDGSAAEQLAECSRPEGAAGLAWVFPNLAAQKCGAPTQTGQGVVLRILCVDRLTDGTRVQVGYYQWRSVRAGTAFYDGQGLTRADEGGFLRWTGGSGGTAKSAVLYDSAPFSITATFPAGLDAAVDAEILVLGPPDQLRGEPVG